MPRTTRKKNKSTPKPKVYTKKDCDDLVRELKKTTAHLDSLNAQIKLCERVLRNVGLENVQAGQKWRFKNDEGWPLTVLRVEKGVIHYCYDMFSTRLEEYTKSSKAEDFFITHCRAEDYDDVMRDHKKYVEFLKGEK